MAEDMPLPMAEGDLRETFDIPLMTEADTSPAPRGADAVALFKDSPPAPRRPAHAEARSKARRCPTCGGVVPMGMSLCSSCGLDLETGHRIGFADEDLNAVPQTGRNTGMPMGIAIVGTTAVLGSAVLMIFSLVRWFRAGEGFEFLALVCLFGIFAGVQFLRGKTVKLLLVALSLGALIDVVALIALPVYNAMESAAITPGNPTAPPEGTSEEVEEAPAVIHSYVQDLDPNKITWGIALLLVYAALVLYLSSPPVRRYFVRQTQGPAQIAMF